MTKTAPNYKVSNKIAFLFGRFLVLMTATLLIVLSVEAYGKDRILGPIPAVIERVVDGDTVKVRAKIWIEQELQVSVRVADIDAPELFRPKCAVEKNQTRLAKSFVEAFFPDGVLYLHEIEADKYAGRVVARITNSRGEDLGDNLVMQDHAVALDNDTSKGFWCTR